MENLFKALQENVCIVSYKKVGTSERRDMECTLNNELIPGHFNISQDPKNDHILVYALDREAWRSFRVNTLIEWNIVAKLNG